MGEVTTRFPWEVRTTEETLLALQHDVAYMVTHTAVLVRGSNSAFDMLVNTPRGQIMPRGECKFADGTVFELQDVGMPQPGAPAMTMRELMAQLWDIARDLGLELP